MKEPENVFYGVCLTKVDKYMVTRLLFGMKLAICDYKLGMTFGMINPC